jgi:hypothetical protein
MDTLAPAATPSPFADEPAVLLRTPRLLLREFAPGDEPALQRMHEDPRLRAAPTGAWASGTPARSAKGTPAAARSQAGSA